MAHKTDFCPLKGLAEVAKRTFRFRNNDVRSSARAKRGPDERRIQRLVRCNALLCLAMN